MDRIVYHLVHKSTDGRWYLTRPGYDRQEVFETREDGVAEARLRCTAHVSCGGEAELIVHRGDGSEESEYPCGDDRTALLH